MYYCIDVSFEFIIERGSRREEGGRRGGKVGRGLYCRAIMKQKFSGWSLPQSVQTRPHNSHTLLGGGVVVDRRGEEKGIMACPL